MAPSSQNDGADLMVQKLYDQGVISQNVFSFQVGTVDGTSHVTIGGYDVEEFSIEKELTWHNLINNFWWTLGLKGVQVGGKDIGVTTKQVIIDTGTSYALMPSSDFRKIQQYFISEGHQCTFENTFFNQFVCQCSDEQYKSYPSIDVKIDERLYTLGPQNYIDRTIDICSFKVMTSQMSGDSAFWIMGLTFFQNYYTVFDLENQRIGIAESKLSTLGNKTDQSETNATVIVSTIAANTTATVILVNNLSQGNPNSFIHNEQSAQIAFYFLSFLALYLISQAINFWNRQNFGEDSGVQKAIKRGDDNHGNDPENGLHHNHNPTNNLL